MGVGFFQRAGIQRFVGAVRPADLDGRVHIVVVVVLRDPDPAVFGIDMGPHLVLHRVDGGVGQKHAGLPVEHPHGAVQGVDGQRGIVGAHIVKFLFLAGKQIVEQIPPRHFGGGNFGLRDCCAGHIIPDGLVVFAEHSALLRADQIHQLISAIVIQADRACTGVLLVTGQLLAGGGAVQADMVDHHVLIFGVIVQFQPVCRGRDLVVGVAQAHGGAQRLLPDPVSVPVLDLQRVIAGQVIAPGVLVQGLSWGVAQVERQRFPRDPAAVGIFRHGQLLAGGKVQHPAVPGGVVQRGGVGKRLRGGQHQQRAGQGGIVGTVKGQDLLAAAVAQGGCPPGGGAWV